MRFHDSMPRLNAPVSLERFGSHGLVHTGRSEIENRKSKVSRMCEFGIYCFLRAFSVRRRGQHKKDPLRPGKPRYDPLRPTTTRYGSLRFATVRYGSLRFGSHGSVS